MQRFRSLGMQADGVALGALAVIAGVPDLQDLPAGSQAEHPAQHRDLPAIGDDDLGLETLAPSADDAELDVERQGGDPSP